MAKGMTKSEVLNALAEKTSKTRKEVAEMIDALVTLAYNETKGSGEFTIPGLGKLLKKHRDARMGRNPATGESIKIAAKTVVKFRVAKAAKDSILA
jgi:DNA-binding protein HU-beta